MIQPNKHPERLRIRVIALFFSGLLLLAIIAVGIGWVCADFGNIRSGWLNQIIGLVLSAGGLALVIWSVNIQYTLGQGTPAPKVATRRLVTSGPYFYTRNPMTLGALLLYTGIGAWLGSGIVMIMTVIVCSGLLAYIHAHETRELTERFGQEYLEYKNKTPFLLPQCRRR